MRVIRWKNAATGVESLNITATGIYFPVGKTDSSFKLKLSMDSAGQTASVDTVRDSSGSRTGYGAMNVSGTTETKLGAVVSFATGIVVTAISGTLNAILDDEIAITRWPEVSLGRFPAIEDLVAYCYGSVPPLGLLATVNGQQVTWGGAGVGWVGANPTRIDRRLRLGTFGDSTATYWSGSDTDTKDLCNTTSFAPNVSQVGAALWKSVIPSPMQHRMPCLYIACGGIGGTATTDMFTRSGATKTATRRAIQDVIAMRPNVIKLSCGSINDLISFDVNTTDAQIYAVADRHKAIAIQFVKSGIPVYDVGILGFSQALTNIAHIRRALVMINARIAQDAASTPGWVFIQTLGVVSDSTGAYLPDMSTDGVHLNARGAMTLGDYEYKHLSGLFTPSFDGEILNDGLADFLNPSSNIPRNSDQWNDSCANVVPSTSRGVMTVSADVTSASTVNFKYLLSGSLAGLASGDAFYSHTRIEAAVDGVPVEFLVNAVTLVYNGATLQINTAENTIMAKGDATVSLHPIKMNFAGASSGSGSVMRLAVVPQTSGRLTLKIYPVTVRKSVDIVGP